MRWRSQRGSAAGDHLQARFRRLPPGATACSSAVRTGYGEVSTQPSRMAAVLRDHWGAVITPPGPSSMSGCGMCAPSRRHRPSRQVEARWQVRRADTQFHFGRVANIAVHPCAAGLHQMVG